MCHVNDSVSPGENAKKRRTRTRKPGARMSRRTYSTKLGIGDAARLSLHLAATGQDASPFIRAAILAALPTVNLQKE